MWNDVSRLKEVRGCLIGTYARYNKKAPDNIDFLTSVWSKDLRSIPDDKLAYAFNLAYEKYRPKSNQSSMFTTRDLLEIWNASHETIVFKKLEGCEKCKVNDGLVAVYDLRKVKELEDAPRKMFRCDCSAGQNWSNKIYTWKPEYRKNNLVLEDEYLKLMEVKNG